MKKKVKKPLFLLLVLFVIGLFASCKSVQTIPATSTEIRDSIFVKEVLRDTIFKIQKDSSYYKSWLECQDGKVMISAKHPIQKQEGKHLNAPKVIIKDNYIEVNCEAQAQELFAKWKEVHRTAQKAITTTKTVLIEKQLSWWQEFQIWSGRISLPIALFFGVRVLQKI